MPAALTCSGRSSHRSSRPPGSDSLSACRDRRQAWYLLAGSDGRRPASPVARRRGSIAAPTGRRSAPGTSMRRSPWRIRACTRLGSCRRVTAAGSSWGSATPRTAYSSGRSPTPPPVAVVDGIVGVTEPRAESGRSADVPAVAAGPRPPRQASALLASARDQSMIVGVGVDVVDVERFGATPTRTPGLRERLFTAAETDAAGIARRPLRGEGGARQGARRTGRPALDGCRGTAGRGRGRDSTSAGLPRRRPAQGIVRLHVSLSHDAYIASAMVVAET